MASIKDYADSFFGFIFKRREEPGSVPSFSPPEEDGGTTTITSPTGGVLGTSMDLDVNIRSEYELISRYREMALHSEIDTAIDEITNEAVSSAGDSEDTVKIILDDLNVTPAVKQAISQSFEEVKQLLDFRHHAYDLFRRWYIDGRLYFHVIVDPKDTAGGIKELRLIDPRKIRKVRELEKVRVKNGSSTDSNNYVILTRVKSEYFVYMESGFQGPSPNDQPAMTSAAGVKIARDSIIYINSGLVDATGNRVLGFLHTALKPLNQLRILEDATVIFKMARSPERRVWKIEVGNLPKAKAEQYIAEIMRKHKNKLSYSASTGEIIDQRKFQTVLEDYWIPTRNGVGTQVSVLPPGQAFQPDDLMYFLKRVYAALRIPVDRLNSDNQVNYPGSASAMSIAEIKFGKFIARLRLRFSQLFIDALEKQLVLKGVMAVEDWERISPYIRFDFVKDNYYMEIKEQQIMQMRIDLANNMMPFIGTVYSLDTLRRQVFKMNDEDIEKEIQLISMEGSAGMQGEGSGGRSMMGGDNPNNQPENQSLAINPTRRTKTSDSKVKDVGKILGKK